MPCPGASGTMVAFPSSIPAIGVVTKPLLESIMSAAAPHTCDTDALNELLRGEISAVETYDQAIAKFEAQPLASDLRRIRDEHQHAVVALRERVTAFGGT